MQINIRKKTLAIAAGVIVLLVAAFLGGMACLDFMTGYGSGSGMMMEGGIAYDKGTSNGIMAPSAASSGNSYDEAYDYEESDSSFTDFSTYGDTDQKWIVRVNMSVETKKYDEYMQVVGKAMGDYGAYASDSDEYNRGGYYGRRRVSMTIRVPVENLDAFLSAMGEGCSVTSKSRNMENITLRYSDAEAYKLSLEVERDQLLKLLEQAGTVDEIIQVRDRLSQLQYQIERQGTTLRTYDDQVAFATVRLTVDEVVQLSQEPTNFFERAWEGIKENLYNTREFVLNVLLWLITHIPAIILVVVSVQVVGWMYRLRKKKARKVKQATVTLGAPKAADPDKKDKKE